MLGWAGSFSAWVLLPWLSLPMALRLVTRITREEGPSLNDALARTAKLELAFALLFSLGWLL